MKYLAIPLALIGSVALLLTALANADDAAARRLYAQSAVIQANSAARLDFMGAALPYLIIAISLIIAAVVILALSFTFLSAFALWSSKPWLQNQPQVERIIERQMIIMIQPGQSRREIYQMLSANSKE